MQYKPLSYKQALLMGYYILWVIKRGKGYKMCLMSKNKLNKTFVFFTFSPQGLKSFGISPEMFPYRKPFKMK